MATPEHEFGRYKVCSCVCATDAKADIAYLRDAIERAIANLDDNHARRVLIRALSKIKP